MIIVVKAMMILKPLWNRRFGPGGGTRQLHQVLFDGSGK